MLLDARQRPRRVRERQGARARRASIASSADPPGGEHRARRGGRADRSAARDGARLWSRRALERARSARSPAEIERRAAASRSQLAGEEALRQRRHQLPGRRIELRDHRLPERLETKESALPVRLYVMVRDRTPTEALAAKPSARYTIDRRRATTIWRCARSSVRSTARSARTAPGCSSRTPTCRAAPGSCSSRWRRSAARPSRDPRTATSSPSHAIGDRANREVLDVYEQAFARNGRPGRPALAHRARPAPRPRRRAAVRAPRRDRVDAGRARTSDGPWVPKRLGDGARRKRRLRVAIAAASRRRHQPTAPTCRSRTIDPLASFHASVTRRTPTASVLLPRSA